MSWIFIGTLLGALVTSTHDNREACEGKAVVLREKGVSGSCHNETSSINLTGTVYYGTTSTITRPR